MRFRHPLLSCVLFLSSVYGIASTLFAGEPTDEVSVASTPLGARVVVDGEERGSTPLSLELTTDREHRIQVVSDGYATVETLVQPVIGWSLVGATVINGLFLGLAQSAVELSTGGARELEPNDVHVHLEPLGPPVRGAGVHGL